MAPLPACHALAPLRPLTVLLASCQVNDKGGCDEPHATSRPIDHGCGLRFHDGDRSGSVLTDVSLESQGPVELTYAVGTSSRRRLFVRSDSETEGWRKQAGGGPSALRTGRFGDLPGHHVDDAAALRETASLRGADAGRCPLGDLAAVVPAEAERLGRLRLSGPLDRDGGLACMQISRERERDQTQQRGWQAAP